MLGQLKIRKISLDDPLLPFSRHLYYTHCKWISLQICRSSWVFCLDFSTIFLSLCVFGFGGLCWVFQDRAIGLVYGHPIWRSLCLASWVFSFLSFFFDLFSYLFSCLLALGCCLLYPLKPLTRQAQLFPVSVRSVNSPAAALPVRCVVVFLKTRFSSFSAFSSPSPVLSSSLPLSSC